MISEYGPELLTTGSNGGYVTSRKKTEKLLGGNNSTPNVTINNNTSVAANASVQQASNGDLIVTLSEVLPDLMAAEMSNPNSKAVKGFKSHTATRRNR